MADSELKSLLTLQVNSPESLRSRGLMDNTLLLSWKLNLSPDTTALPSFVQTLDTKLSASQVSFTDWPSIRTGSGQDTLGLDTRAGHRT